MGHPSVEQRHREMDCTGSTIAREDRAWRGRWLQSWAATARAARWISVVDAVLAGARELGTETRKIYLIDQHIEYCRNCRSCTQNEGMERQSCVIQDDVAGILAEIERADTVVLASPVNFYNVTAIFRVFLERLLGCVYWPWGQASSQAALQAAAAQGGADRIVGGAGISDPDCDGRTESAAHRGQVPGRTHGGHAMGWTGGAERDAEDLRAGDGAGAQDWTGGVERYCNSKRKIVIGRSDRGAAMDICAALGSFASLRMTLSK